MGNSTSDRIWALADETMPIRLMATNWADTAGLHDDFATPAGVDAWLDAVGVDRADTPTTQDEFVTARNLRNAVRRLAAHVTDDDRSAAESPLESMADAVFTVNAAASKRPVPQLRLSGAALELSPESSESSVIAGLADIAYEAQHLFGQDGSTLRACHAPGCVLYFVKTHPRREWCSVACGNRARAARHYLSIRSARSAHELTAR